MLFKALKCHIKYLSPDNKLYKLISGCFKNCKGPTHNFTIKLDKIYEIERAIEKVRYYPFQSLFNKRLLWHGSRITNFVGIFSQGLRVAPPDAPSSGYMFGKGIYFTNVPTKAAQYCNCTKDQDEGLLLLCEVALGNMYPQESSHVFKSPPIGYHSVMGVGKMGPECAGLTDIESGMNTNVNIGLDIGGIVANENEKSLQLQYSEFVVYDCSQVRIRYACKVRLTQT